MKNKYSLPYPALSGLLAKGFILLVFLLSVTLIQKAQAQAQTAPPDTKDYSAYNLQKHASMPVRTNSNAISLNVAQKPGVNHIAKALAAPSNNCLIPVDDSYTLLQIEQVQGSSGLIVLPF